MRNPTFPRKWEVPGQGFQLEVFPAVWSRLWHHCLFARSKETGGILLGRYTEDGSLAQAIEAPDPAPDTRAGHTWLIRGTHGLSSLLAARWRSRRRLHYIGEWHYHPTERLEPSRQDLSQMEAIANRQQYQCPEPIMILLGRPRNASRKPPVRIFVFPDGQPMEFKKFLTIRLEAVSD